MKSIASAANPTFKRWLRLVTSPREVRVQRRTFAEGPHLAEAIFHARHPVEALVIRRGADRPDASHWIDAFAGAGAAGFELPAALFDRLSPVERGSGVLLLIPLPGDAPLEKGDALFFDGIQDPGNAGALLRVAAAAGVRNVLAAPGTVALWSPKVLRGAQGAHFRLRLQEDVSAADLSRICPMTWVGASAHGGTPLWSTKLTDEAVGFAVGAEGAGLSPETSAACARHVSIPLANGVESLNVAAAAAVCLFERRRQRDMLRA